MVNTVSVRTESSGPEVVTTFQGRIPALGRCTDCGVAVRLDSFRSRAGLCGYTAGNACQQCQDAASAGVEPDQLLCGAVVGCGTRGCEDGRVAEFALLPFRFAATGAWYEWEPRFLFRVGTNLPRVDPWHELVPMADRWRDHQVRVREFRCADDPTLLDGLEKFELLLAPDLRWLDAAVNRFSRLTCTARLSLSTILAPDLDALGLLPRLRSWAWLEGMLPYVPAPDEPSSSLRTCALLAAFLDRGFASSSVRPMDVVLRWSMAQDEAVELEAVS